MSGVAVDEGRPFRVVGDRGGQLPRAVDEVGERGVAAVVRRQDDVVPQHPP
jgi:hypothetical protein